MNNNNFPMLPKATKDFFTIIFILLKVFVAFTLTSQMANSIDPMALPGCRMDFICLR